MSVHEISLDSIDSIVVDEAFGRGTFERWVGGMLEELIAEQELAKAHIERYSQDWAKPIVARLQADLRFAESVNFDYADFLARVSRSGNAFVIEHEKIRVSLELAVSILREVNFTISEMTGLGFKGMFMSLQSLRLAAQAYKLKNDMGKLRSELEKAARETSEAMAQLIFNTSLNAFLAISGPVGWLALGGAGLAQIVVDTYLGPSTSATATIGSRGTTSIGVVVSASEKYLAESSKVVRVTTPAGKVIPIVGVIFDVNEISTGYQNIVAVDRAMKAVKRSQEKLYDTVLQHRTLFASLKQKINQLETRLIKGKDYTKSLRLELQNWDYQSAQAISS